MGSGEGQRGGDKWAGFGRIETSSLGKLGGWLSSQREQHERLRSMKPHDESWRKGQILFFSTGDEGVWPGQSSQEPLWGVWSLFWRLRGSCWGFKAGRGLLKLARWSLHCRRRCRGGIGGRHTWRKGRPSNPGKMGEAQGGADKDGRAVREMKSGALDHLLNVLKTPGQSLLSSPEGRSPGLPHSLWSSLVPIRPAERVSGQDSAQSPLRSWLSWEQWAVGLWLLRASGFGGGTLIGWPGHLSVPSPQP